MMSSFLVPVICRCFSLTSTKMPSRVHRAMGKGLFSNRVLYASSLSRRSFSAFFLSVIGRTVMTRPSTLGTSIMLEPTASMGEHSPFAITMRNSTGSPLLSLRLTLSSLSFISPTSSGWIRSNTFFPSISSSDRPTMRLTEDEQ